MSVLLFLVKVFVLCVFSGSYVLYPSICVVVDSSVINVNSVELFSCDVADGYLRVCQSEPAVLCGNGVCAEGELCAVNVSKVVGYHGVAPTKPALAAKPAVLCFEIVYVTAAIGLDVKISDIDLEAVAWLH